MPDDGTGVILDTDLGSDVDDLIALTVLGRLIPQRLRAISTVYGDTVLRARLVAHACERLGLDAIPIIAGTVNPMRGGPPWATGQEGVGWPLRGDERIEDRSTGSTALSEAIDAQSAPVDLIAVGPLTNLAWALEHDPRLHERVRRVFIMGGFFGGRRVEHNFHADPLAAERVFASQLPITVCGLEITLRAWIGEAEVAALESEDETMARLIAAEARRWWAYSSEATPGDSPHDAVCALALIKPELFTTQACEITIASAGSRAGASVAVPSAAARHHLVIDLMQPEVDAAVFSALMDRTASLPL
jgi:purine nucleosidase